MRPQNASQKTARPEKQYQKAALVSVSVLALSALPFLSAYGQTLKASCPQNFKVGEHAACGTGSLRINPDGSVSTAACIVTLTNPDPGKCTVSVTGGTATRDVIVSVTQASIFLSATGQQVTVDDFRLQDTAKTMTGTKVTYTPAEITAPVNIDVGGRLNFSNNQPSGIYTGKLSVKAVFN